MPVIDREPTADIGAAINPLPNYEGPVFPEITNALPVTEILDPTKNLEVIRGRNRFEVRSELVYQATSTVGANEKGRDRLSKRRGSRGRRNRGCTCNRYRRPDNSSTCMHSGLFYRGKLN